MDINPKHLESLEAIALHGTFSAAAIAVGRSHSAVSLHIKALEQALATQLVDRDQRPPVLTPDGTALVEQAHRYRAVMDDIRAIGRSERLSGTLSVGVVPTAMTHLMPPALASLRQAHPDLGIEIRSDLSGRLAAALAGTDLDAAVLTGPDLARDDIILHPVAEEPLVVIAPAGATGTSDAAVLAAHPFIWFSRATWAGQQIERRLLDRGIAVRATMEVDSLEAIAALVRHGLGASIVPLTAGSITDGLHRVPFCTPQARRRLVLATRRPPAKARLADALLTALRSVPTVVASDSAPGEGHDDKSEQD